MATVSVIIPAYNAAATLGETLQSVLAQTFSDFEIIVVDDGSSDETGAIVQQTQDQRIRLLTTTNGGAAIARNRGIEQATGELITFLDADDLWTAEKLQDQVAALQAHPEADVVYSWTDYIDPSGQRLYGGAYTRHQGNVYAALFQQNFIENGSNLMVRATALQRVGLFDPDLASVHDWDLWLRLALQSVFVVVPKPQILYRVMPQSISSNFVRQECNTLKVIQGAVARSPEQLTPHLNASLSHLYQYLTFRSLSLGHTRRQYLDSLRFWLLAIRYRPQLLRQRTKLMAITLAKTLLGLLISPRRLHSRLHRQSNPQSNPQSQPA